MKRPEIDAVLKSLHKETEQLIELRSKRQRRDEYDQIIRQRAAQRRTAIQDARKRTDPKRTARLLIELVYRLRIDGKLSFEAREYLADAILSMVQRPDGAAAAFGLKPAAHRPPSREVELRNLGMVLRVEELAATMPVHPNRKGVSAVETVAQEFGENADVVEYALKNAWGKRMRR